MAEANTVGWKEHDAISHFLVLNGCSAFLINRYRPTTQTFHTNAEHEVEDREGEEEKQPGAGGCPSQ